MKGIDIESWAYIFDLVNISIILITSLSRALTVYTSAKLMFH